jgi:AcrR family transcriptional regulator
VIGMAQKALVVDRGVPANRRGRARSARVDQAILDAALELLVETGMDGLSFERVAIRAGVGKPTVYRRYDGKLDLLLAVLASLSDPQVIYRDTGTSRGDLEAIVTSLASLLVDTVGGRLLPLIIAEGNRTPELAARYHAFIAARREAFKAALARCVSRGDLRDDIGLDFVADSLAAPIYMRFLVTGEPLDARFIEITVDATLRAFAPVGHVQLRPLLDTSRGAELRYKK